MKKVLVGMFLGFVLHMLYLDTILLRQFYILDHCNLNEKADKNGKLPCLKYSNETGDRFYGKYFGIYALIHWKQVYIKWRLE